MNGAVEGALWDLWRSLRDDASHHRQAEAQACVEFAYRAELLTSDERELWTRRIPTCPGHDDEGGRDWCAYCGGAAACTYCEGTGVIYGIGILPSLQCPECLGTKKDFKKLRERSFGVARTPRDQSG